jgi:rRNA maturation endonuclease Nob1
MSLPTDYGEYCPNCQVEFDLDECRGGGERDRCPICGHESEWWPVNKAAKEWLDLEMIWQADEPPEEAT